MHLLLCVGCTHHCALTGYITGDYSSCTQIPRDSTLGLAQASHPLLSTRVQIEAGSVAENMVPMTRNYLCNRGVELSELVEVGEIIAVYLEDTTEPWMLGKVLKAAYEITSQDAVYTWMGQMKEGDRVLLVQKLEPTAGGLASSFFQLTDKIFPCWLEDVRVAKVGLKQSSTERRSGRIAAAQPVNPLSVRWELPTSERERVLVTLPVIVSDLESENIDKHKEKRRAADYQVDEGEVGRGNAN